MGAMLVLVAFLLLALLTCAVTESRRALLRRTASDWWLDGLGLLVQGVLIPLLQTTGVYALFAWLVPQAQGALDVSPVVAFLLNFVAVDYLYYWNHRLLHGNRLWDTQAVHHTAERMDVFITSRNTLWSSLLIVYVWINGLLIFLLKDPTAFILSAALTASLDLWRHTSLTFQPQARLHRLLAGLLITPNEHAWHHSRRQADKNFGANLSLWDRLHGTYARPAALPSVFGIPSSLNLTRKLWFPFRARKAAAGP